MQIYDENGSYIGTKLWNRGFIAMLITQFTVAMNDNLFRWLLVPIGKDYFEADLIRMLGGVFLLLPFLLWASIAGYITDRYSRRSIMIWCKFVEMVLLAVAVAVIACGPEVDEPTGYGKILKISILLGILFLLGTQSTFFSPSKYGTVPDLVPKSQISQANGILAMLTMIACVSGQILGGFVYFWTTSFSAPSVAVGIPGGQSIGITAAFLVGIAGIGFASSFFVPHLKPVAPAAKFPKWFLYQNMVDLQFLYRHRRLFCVALASAFFWGLAALAAIVIDKFAQEWLLVQQQHITILAAILSIGIGAGAVLAGILSRGRIELGIVPVGAFGMGVFLLALGFTPAMAAGMLRGEGTVTSFPYLYSAVFLFLVGVAAGLYDIPLAAFLQKESPVESRGRILAAYNFISFSAMLVFTGSFFLFSKVMTVVEPYTGISPAIGLWYFCGFICLAVCGTLVWYLFIPLFSWVSAMILRVVYRMEIYGLENIPEEGAALLVSNHQSYLDAGIIYSSLPRPVRGVAHKEYMPGWFLNYLCDRIDGIRILPGKQVVQAIRKVRAALSNGELVCLCPEGAITRTGQVKSFEPGFLAMINGNEDKPIIPVYIGGFYGSMFSFAFGPKLILWPRRLSRRPFIAFGKPLYLKDLRAGERNSTDTNIVAAESHTASSHSTSHDTDVVAKVRRAVEELGVDILLQHPQDRSLLIPPRKMIRQLRNGKNKGLRLADSTGLKLTSYEFLIRAIAAKNVLRTRLLSPEEKNVGLLIPPTVGGALANVALAMDGRTAVNLNYTFGNDTLNYCIKKAEIKRVIASRKMLERFPDLKLDAELFFIEDLPKLVTTRDKFVAAAMTYLFPTCLLERVLGLHRIQPDDPITIFFTSGSTGTPKGAVITHRNLAENAEAFVSVFKINAEDRFVSMLPLFHAFGYTANLWPALLSDCSVVFHYSPLEPKKIGEISRQYKGTIMASTPTFLRSFLRRCPKEDFEMVNTVIAGAEKLPRELVDAWQEKFGYRPGEGYGMTELSPVVSANVPLVEKSEKCPNPRLRDDYQPCYREGAVGRPLPNLVAKVVDLETGEELPPNISGMLLLKSPYVMQGYYKDPEKTAEVLKDGWYTTGDVAKIDEEGFIFITGRQSRMSKIGGEMVPHILIEDAIDQMVRASSDTARDDEGVLVAVTSLPDVAKGEKIIVLHRPMTITAEEIVKKLQTTSDMPLLWIPSVHNFREVTELPLLGTGKLDLRGVKKLAEMKE